jgi:outer membrane protein TolC
MRFQQQISACLRHVTAAGAVAVMFGSGLTVSAFGQTAAAPPQPAQAPQASVAQPAQQITSSAGALKITQDDAVRMALENNLGVQAERLNPRIQDLALSRAYSAYTPELFASTTRSSSTAPPRDFLSQGVDVTTSGSLFANGGIRQQVPWFGGAYSIGLAGSRATSDAPRTAFSPQLGSDLDLAYDQPLLRGFRIDAFRQNIETAKNQSAIVDLQLVERITQTSRQVRNVYLTLINAISGLDVAQQSLDLARQTYKNNQRRVEVGTTAQIDLIAAEAEVARSEEDVIVRQGNIEAAQDALRTLILNPTQTDFWSTPIEPAEQPVLTQQPIDIETITRNALANRTDIGQLRKELDNVDVNIRFNKDQKLPSVNLRAGYGLTGVGGTQFQYGPDPIGGGVPPIISTNQRNFSDVLRDVFGNDFRSWNVAVNFSYPLGTSLADAALAQNRIQRQQGDVAIRELELEITRQVRDAVRNVQTTLKRVEATGKARQLAERQLEAEEKRLAVGLSDTFRIVQYQRDLANQKRAELTAIIEYNRALIDLEAVQVVPIR